MNPPIDLSRIVLHTERLTLRLWRESDLTDFYEYARVDGVGQAAGWSPHKSIEESQRILETFIREKKTFAIVCEGKVIGSLGVEAYDERELPEFDEKRGRELGFVLAKPYWGRGLMPEAVNAVVRWLFEDEGLDFLVCGHFDGNTRSQRVQEKCGFRHYKRVRHKTRMGSVRDGWLSILER